MRTPFAFAFVLAFGVVSLFVFAVGGGAGCTHGDGLGTGDAAARDLRGATDLVPPPADLTVGPGADLTPPAVDLGRPDQAPAVDLARPVDLAAVDSARPGVVACGQTSCPSPATSCCRASPFGTGTCVRPGEPCAAQRYDCDDPADCAPAEVCCHPTGGGASCLAAGACSGQRMCMASSQCSPGEQCCGVGPSPAYFCGVICPISRRKYKDDIHYLDEAERRRLAASVVGMPLARWRYRDRDDRSQHLGFIIDDVLPSPAVDASGERVDLYGYTTMAVAALQEQAREIAELRRELAELRREVGHRQGGRTAQPIRSVGSERRVHARVRDM